MSADRYAQFIAEQQKKLSVSGTNAVNLEEKKELSDKQKKIANLAGDKDEIDAEDLKKLRSKKKDDDDKDDDKDDQDDDKSDDKDDDDDKPAFMKKKVEESKDATKEVSNMLASKGKTLERNKTGLAVLRNVKPKAKTVKEEAAYISEEEAAYIEEMVGKGKLNDVADFHQKAAHHAYKMRVHHQMMADKSEDVGDSVGFDHHIERAMQHDYDYEHHQARFDHAAGLKAKNQAMKDLAAAKTKVAKARDAKRDWA